MVNSVRYRIHWTTIYWSSLLIWKVYLVLKIYIENLRLEHRPPMPGVNMQLSHLETNNINEVRLIVKSSKLADHYWWSLVLLGCTIIVTLARISCVNSQNNMNEYVCRYIWMATNAIILFKLFLFFLYWHRCLAWPKNLFFLHELEHRSLAPKQCTKTFL